MFTFALTYMMKLGHVTTGILGASLRHGGSAWMMASKKLFGTGRCYKYNDSVKK